MPRPASGRSVRCEVLPVDLERLDVTLQAAIAGGSPKGLDVLGFGEITLVVGWPTEAPEVAVKRLPPFPGPARAEAYRALLATWTAALEAAGVPIVDTEVLTVEDPSEVRCYLVQPLVPRGRLLNEVLRHATPEQADPLIARLVRHVVASVNERVGLDAQAANWVVDGEELRCLDVSTPLLRDERGRDRLDLGLFLSIYPWMLRPLLGPIAHSIMATFHDPRGVLLDTASNLVKEELDAWVPALLGHAAPHVATPIDEAEVRRYFTRDRRLWLLMQRLRRADRAWQRAVRRRPYPFLLPPPYRYGPPPPAGDTRWTTPAASS